MKHPRIKEEFKGGGTCDICDSPALLAFHDESTGQRFGKCCVRAMIFSDKVWNEVAGVSHPKNGL